MPRKINVIFPLLLAFCMTTIFPPSLAADYVFNADLGKFVRADAEFFETAAEQFEHAKELEEKKAYKDAEAAYNFVYRKFPDSPLAQEAIMRIGAVQEKEAKYNQAFQSYQVLIDNYPQSAYTNEVLEKQYQIGNMFLSGKKGKILNLPILPARAEAVKVFKKINENAPFSEYGIKALYQLALTYKKKKENADAILTFQKFIDNYPTHELIPEAYFQLAELSYNRSMSRNNDRRLYKEAKERLNDFLRRYPNTADTERVARYLVNLDERDAESLYNIALYYEQTGYLDSAIVYYEELVATYPELGWAKKAKKRLGSFDDPKKFLLEGQKMLETKLGALEAERLALSGAESAADIDKHSEILATIDQVQSDLKRLDKEKKNEVRIRWESLRRKRWELVDKKRKLKEKALKKSPSSDLEVAIARWRDSIEAEEYVLKMEERDIIALEKSLGVKNYFPFKKIFKRSTLGFGDIENFKSKNIQKLKDELNAREAEKEELYEAVRRIDTDLTDLKSEQELLYDSVQKGMPRSEKEAVALLRAEEEYDVLKDTLRSKREELSEHEGFAAKIANVSGKSFTDSLNPFKKKAPESLAAKKQKMSEKIVSLKKEIDYENSQIERLKVLSADLEKVEAQAATEEAPEIDRALRTVAQETIDSRQARKQVMALEKKINTAHQSVNDGYAQKARLLAELDETVMGISKERTPFIVRSLRAVFSPFVALYKGTHAFLFGLKDTEIKIAEKTAQLEKKELDNESLARVSEIKERIKRVSDEVRRAELSIVEFEVELEKLIQSLQGEIEIKKLRSLQTDKQFVENDIVERSAYLAALQNELHAAELLFEKTSLTAETEKAAPLSEKDKKDFDTNERVRLIKVDIAQIEDALGEKKKELDRKKEVFHLSRRRVLEASDKKKNAIKDVKLQKKIDAQMNDKSDRVQYIRAILDEELVLLSRYNEIMQAKLARIKKHIEVMDKYQDKELTYMKELQKKTYQTLDEINSARIQFESERARLDAA